MQSILRKPRNKNFSCGSILLSNLQQTTVNFQSTGLQIQVRSLHTTPTNFNSPKRDKDVFVVTERKGSKILFIIKFIFYSALLASIFIVYAIFGYETNRSIAFIGEDKEYEKMIDQELGFPLSEISLPIFGLTFTYFMMGNKVDISPK
jgi:hypothetical protein